MKNDEIRSKNVILVTEDGLKEMSLRAAQDEADKQGLDLVQVSEKEGMPLCKILNYSKMEYEKEKAKKKNKKGHSKVELKEIKMGYSIQENDLKVKVKNISRILNKDGDKVKVQVVLRGREKDYTDIAEEKLTYIMKAIEGEYVCKDGIKNEGATVYMILEPANSK